jgi:tape measure domain-containing protein
VSAVANVAVNLDSRGVPAKLKQIADRGKEVDRSLNGAAAATTKAGREFKSAGNAASQAAGGFNKLGKAIGGIITAAAALQALKFTIVSTAELETQTRSLKVLTGSLETAQKIVQQLQDIGAVTPFTSTELIDTAKRLSAFGVETEKLVETTRRLGDVAGATGADLGGIATAFGQIQAKGRLQGEELLQLQERGIDLQSELQRMYGLTGEEFRKALEKGRFSAEAVDVALQNLTNTGGKYANGAIAQSDTLAGKFSTLQDGITRTAQALGQVLSPALQTILDQAIGVVNSINNALAAGRRIQQFGINAQQRNQLFQQAGREAEEIALLRGGGKIDPATFTQLRDERFRDLIERFGYETGQIQVETKAPTLETPRVPELLGGGGGAVARGAGAGAAKDAQRAADAAEREAEQRRINLRNQDQLIERLRAQVVLQNSFTDGDRIMNQMLLDQLEIRQDIENRMEGASDAMKQLLIQEADLRSRLAMDKAAEPFVRAGMNMGGFMAEAMEKSDAEKPNLVRDLSAQVKQLQDELNPVKLATETITNGAFAIGDAFGQAFTDVISGAKSTEEALADTFESIGKAFLGMAAEIIAKQLTMIALQTILKALGAISSGFSFAGGSAEAGLDAANQMGGVAPLDAGMFGFRANGGPVNANQPYIVGERGPELFMPSNSGMVLSNNATREKLEQQDAVMLSNEATRQQLIKQQNTMTTNRIREVERTSQAMLASPDPIDVRYESSVINNVEYVTAEQHRKGMAQAAERGRALTLQALQNSVKTRSRVGI